MNELPKSIPLTTPKFGDEEVEAVRRVLESKWVTQGPATREFENLIASRHGAKHGVATTSCTAALHLAALALGLQPGDEVIVPAFTWVTSAHCAEYVGARAVFADVDLTTFNLDPAAVAAAITPRTKAIVAVHLFGLAAPLDELKALAARHGLFIIEDAACAIGTTYKGLPVGAVGDVGCFSFHPRKVITTGEGGLVTTNSDQFADRARTFRNHGTTAMPASDPLGKHPYTMAEFGALGYNLRLSDIQAAVGIAQYARLDQLLVERRGRAQRYLNLLADVPDLALPKAGNNEGHAYQSFVIRVREGGRARRNHLMDRMQEAGIQTRPGTHAVHRLGYYYDRYRIDASAFPNACVAEDTTITLPIFPGMTDVQQDSIVDRIRTFI
ncbi:MAG: DegT/DnrJ/EryC1/StrS family aminotransferase [Pseudomonadota bacterium]